MGLRMPTPGISTAQGYQCQLGGTCRHQPCIDQTFIMSNVMSYSKFLLANSSMRHLGIDYV